ncbi:MAG: DUF1330 domain-containing protein [Simplicispira suum]|uniref:DUF1330 domain-containing protein n=1 Tax=Simplicispira suum TaxID=2109915 RepID=UPI001C6B9160|nr:DUF1330 domain-containing protein [Simplicispira suum]MBW7832774.1 DUF1330 domain-containing protein [Simplicispira suum]
MPEAYVVGHLTVKNAHMWEQYRSKVPQTLESWDGQLVFRGKQVAAFAGECPHSEIVVIRFPSAAAAQAWFASPAYQALIPIRTQAADVRLISYEI